MTINLANGEDINITFNGVTVVVRAVREWKTWNKPELDWLSVQWGDQVATRKGSRLVVKAPGKAPND